MSGPDEQRGRQAEPGPDGQHGDVLAGSGSVEEAGAPEQVRPGAGRHQLLVPAVMALLGKRAWWMPKRLERIVPDVEIEGEVVMKGLPAS